MMDWYMMELYAQFRATELAGRRSQPLPPPKPSFGTAVKQRLAQGLVALGVRLDAEASRAAIGSPETAPQLNGSDA